MKVINDKTYSRAQFPEYKFRIKVEFDVRDKDHHEFHSFDIYTDETDKNKIQEAIDKSVTEKVFSFEIVNWNTREQDDATAKFIDEVLNSI